MNINNKRSRWSKKEVLFLILTSILWFPMILVVIFTKMPKKRKVRIEIISTIVAIIIGYASLTLLSVIASRENTDTRTLPTTAMNSINTKKILSLLDQKLKSVFIKNKDLNVTAAQFIDAAKNSNNGSIDHSLIMKNSNYGYSSYTYYIASVPSEQAYINDLLSYANKHSNWQPSSYNAIGVATFKSPDYSNTLIAVVFANPSGNVRPGYMQQRPEPSYNSNNQDQPTSPDLPPADFGEYSGYDPYAGDYGNPSDSSSDSPSAPTQPIGPPAVTPSGPCVPDGKGGYSC